MAVKEVYPTTQLLQIPDSIFHAYDIRGEVDKNAEFWKHKNHNPSNTA